MKTVGIFIQCHGSYCSYSNTSHILIENNKLKFVSRESQRDTPIVFKLNNNVFVYDTSFPGYSTIETEDDDNFICQTLNGKDNDNYSFANYIVDSERIKLEKPSKIWHFGDRFVYTPGDMCPNRGLTVEINNSKLETLHIRIHYFDEKEGDESIREISIINLLNMFGWSDDYESQYIFQQCVPIGKTRSSGFYKENDIVIPISVLIQCVQSVFSLSNVDYIFYLDNCAPFHDDIKKNDEDLLLDSYVKGILNHNYLFSSLLKKVITTTKIPEHCENKIMPEKYDDGFISGYQILKWNYFLWNLIENNYSKDEPILCKIAQQRKSAILRAYKKWGFKTSIKSFSLDSKEITKENRINYTNIEWLQNHILHISFT